MRINTKNIIKTIATMVCLILIAATFSSSVVSVPSSNIGYHDLEINQKNREHECISPIYDEGIADLIQQINESMILGYIENLTAFGPRVTGTQVCDDAGIYIYNEFRDMGLDVRYQNWTYSATIFGSNIEASLYGENTSSDEIYLFCAHYDSVPGSPGADDDGSGVAAVLAAAKVLSQYVFNHTIRFVLFSGEEQGRRGSYFYAGEAHGTSDSILAVLNADMIGYALTEDEGNKVEVMTNEVSEWIANFAVTVSQWYQQYIDLELFPVLFEVPLSDHYSFWQFGYDAVWYFEYRMNPHYHSPDDTIENMNITYDVKVSRLLMVTLGEMAQRCPPNTPTISGPTSGMARVEYEYAFVTTDSDGDDIYYYVDWGDDTDSSWLGPYESGETVEAEHEWEDAGNYGIKIKSKDASGMESHWSDPLVIIITSPLKANANGPYYGLVNHSISLIGSAYDAFPPYTWHWDFGDGNTSNLMNPTHEYNNLGSYLATLTVTDSEGNSDNDTALVTIIPVSVWVDNDFVDTTPGWGYTHFDSICDGIDAVLENGMVYVYNGTYYENVVIDKTIVLIGEDEDTTIIDGDENGEVIHISANGVTLNGFTIQHSGSNADDAGIKVQSDNNSIYDNIIIYNKVGIYLSGASDNTIYLTTINNNQLIGIVMYMSSSNIISENIINIHGWYGIQPYDASNNIISDNIITDSQLVLLCGLHSTIENY